jgi:hypothetical protein
MTGAGAAGLGVGGAAAAAAGRGGDTDAGMGTDRRCVVCTGVCCTSHALGGDGVRERSRSDDTAVSIIAAEAVREVMSGVCGTHAAVEGLGDSSPFLMPAVAFSSGTGQIFCSCCLTSVTFCVRSARSEAFPSELLSEGISARQCQNP